MQEILKLLRVLGVRIIFQNIWVLILYYCLFLNRYEKHDGNNIEYCICFGDKKYLIISKGLESKSTSTFI